MDGWTDGRMQGWMDMWAWVQLHMPTAQRRRHMVSVRCEAQRNSASLTPSVAFVLKRRIADTCFAECGEADGLRQPCASLLAHRPQRRACRRTPEQHLKIREARTGTRYREPLISGSCARRRWRPRVRGGEVAGEHRAPDSRSGRGVSSEAGRRSNPAGERQACPLYS